jgi:hypothetical protein
MVLCANHRIAQHSTGSASRSTAKAAHTIETASHSTILSLGSPRTSQVRFSLLRAHLTLTRWPITLGQPEAGCRKGAVEGSKGALPFDVVGGRGARTQKEGEQTQDSRDSEAQIEGCRNCQRSPRGSRRACCRRDRSEGQSTAGIPARALPRRGRCASRGRRRQATDSRGTAPTCSNRPSFSRRSTRAGPCAPYTAE